MANEPGKRMGQTAGLLTGIGYGLLLVPEAALIVVLLCLHMALGSPPLVAILALVLVGVFAIRSGALHLARRWMESARYRDAAALTQLAGWLYPWSADVWALRGTLAQAIDKPELAELALRRAVTLLPWQPALHAALSSALLELGRPVEAATAARQALAINQRYALAYLYLAEAERATGAAPEQAEDLLREGVGLAQDSAERAALQCGLAAHLLGQRRVAEATLILHTVEALLPNCPAARQAELRFRLGELLSAEGQIERAREHFRGVEALDPQGRYAAAAWRGARL